MIEIKQLRSGSPTLAARAVSRLVAVQYWTPAVKPSDVSIHRVTSRGIAAYELRKFKQQRSEWVIRKARCVRKRSALRHCFGIRRCCLITRRGKPKLRLRAARSRVRHCATPRVESGTRAVAERRR